MTDLRGDGADLFLAAAGTALAADDRVRTSALLSAAIALVPAHIGAMALLVQLHLQSHDFDKAVLWLERVAALDPGNARTVEYLSLMLCQTDRPAVALQRLEAAISRAPTSSSEGDQARILYDTARTLRRYRDVARQMAFAPSFRIFDTQEEEREIRWWRKALTAYARTNLQEAIRFLVSLDPRYGGISHRRLVPSDLSRLKEMVTADLHIRPGSFSGGGGERFLIIRSHSSGFCADVAHVAVQLVVARACGRQPLVYWGRESAYADPAIDNVWDAFFEPVGTVSLSDLEGKPLRCVPPPFTTANLRWSNNQPWFHNESGASALEIIGRDDEIAVVERFNLVTELLFVLPDDHPLKNRSPIDAFWSEFSRSVRLRPGIRAEAQDWLDQHRDGAPVIGIHMRLSSNEKAFESLEQARPNLGSALQALDRFVDQHRDGRIFVMTDYQPYIEDLKRRYPGRVISRPVARLDEQTAGLRQLGLGAPTGNFGLAAEVVRDIATASLCDCFIGDGASSVSLVIAGLGGWTPDRLTWTRAPNVLGNRWAEFLAPPRHAQPERTFVVHAL